MHGFDFDFRFFTRHCPSLLSSSFVPCSSPFPLPPAPLKVGGGSQEEERREGGCSNRRRTRPIRAYAVLVLLPFFMPDSATAWLPFSSPFPSSFSSSFFMYEVRNISPCCFCRNLSSSPSLACT